MYKGIILILSAEFLFASASALAKYVSCNSPISAVQVTFFRFLVGFIVTSYYAYNRNLSVRPNKWRLVIQRGVFNTLAVVFFFAGIQYTTVTNANMLNMTYPFFVFLLAPFINKEQTPRIYMIFLISAMVGVYLIAFPDFSRINRGDLFALLSAVMAGFGITTLREATKFDNPYVILFYLMGIGTILNGIIMLPIFTLQGSKIVWAVLITSAVGGYLGQVCLTKGYQFISAAGGSLVSSSRTIFAMIIGTVFFGEYITGRTAAGSLLIIASLIAMSGVFDRYIRPNWKKS